KGHLRRPATIQACAETCRACGRSDGPVGMTIAEIQKLIETADLVAVNIHRCAEGFRVAIRSYPSPGGETGWLTAQDTHSTLESALREHLTPKPTNDLTELLV